MKRVERYRVELASARVERELEDWERQFKVHRQVLAALEKIGEQPHRPQRLKVKKLSDRRYRARVARCRIIYHVIDSERLVVVDGFKKRTETTYRER